MDSQSQLKIHPHTHIFLDSIYRLFASSLRSIELLRPAAADGLGTDPQTIVGKRLHIPTYTHLPIRYIALTAAIGMPKGVQTGEAK